METKKDILLLRLLLQRVLLLDQKGWYYMDKWKLLFLEMWRVEIELELVEMNINIIIYRYIYNYWHISIICGVICLDIIVKNSCKFSRFGINSGLLCEVVNHCINTIIQYSTKKTVSIHFIYYIIHTI